jgi:hypothetical protein
VGDIEPFLIESPSQFRSHRPTHRRRGGNRDRQKVAHYLRQHYFQPVH